MAKNLADYIDEMGMVIHLSTDDSAAGDSSQRTCMAFIANYDLPYRPEEIWGHDIYKDSEPRRYWDDSKWPGQKGFMSRDNLFGWICVMRVFHMKFELPMLLTQIAKRGGFLWNTKKIGQQDDAWKIPDWCGVLMWFIAFRGKNKLYDFIGDMCLWLALRIRCYQVRKDMDDVGDDLNLCVAIETMRILRDTETLKKARKWYLAWRPDVFLLEDGEESSNVKQALRWYFRAPEAPPLDVLWGKVIDQWA